MATSKGKERMKRGFNVPDAVPATPGGALKMAEKISRIGYNNFNKTNRCVLLIQTADAEMNEKNAAFVPSICIGRMTDAYPVYFLTVEHRIDYREAEIPESSEAESPDPNKRSPSGIHQIWPAWMPLKIKLQAGYDKTSEGEIMVNHIQQWTIGIPALNVSSNVRGNQEVEMDTAPVPVELGSDNPSPAEQALQRIITVTNDKEEVKFLKDLAKDGKLFYLRICTRPRQLVNVNTFLIPSPSKDWKHVEQFVEKLRSSEVADTKISLELIFQAPKNVDPSLSALAMSDTIQKFKQAQALENARPDIFDRMYGVSPTMGLRSSKNSKKPLDALPDPEVRIPIPLVYYSIKDWVRAQDLDLHAMYSLQRKAFESFSRIPMQCRTLLLDKGTTRTFGVLIRTAYAVGTNITLQSGQVGQITWSNRKDMTNWSVFICDPPKNVLGTDTFAVAFPRKNEEGKISEKLPRFIIDVETEEKAGTLHESLNNGPFDEVYLELQLSDVTEKQQIKALCAVNPFSEPDPACSQMRVTVPAILTGQSLMDLTSKSVYSEGFVERMLHDPSELNQKFAEGINIPGAELSEEQVNMVLKYPNIAPSDGLLLAQGHAGTRKTSSIGAFAIAQYLDTKPDGSKKTGVIVSEMHSTANHTVKSLENIIRVGTGGKLAVREYGLEQDIRSILFALDGCPTQYGARWTHRMDPDVFTDMNDMRAVISETVKKEYGSSKPSKFSAVEHSAIWIILKRYNQIQKLGGTSKHPRAPINLPAVEMNQYITIESEVNRVRYTLAHMNSDVIGPLTDSFPLTKAMEIAVTQLTLEEDEAVFKEVPGADSEWNTVIKTTQDASDKVKIQALVAAMTTPCSVIVIKPYEELKATAELVTGQLKELDEVIFLYRRSDGQYSLVGPTDGISFRIFVHGGFAGTDDVPLQVDEPIEETALSKALRRREKMKEIEDGIREPQKPPPRAEYSQEQLDRTTALAQQRVADHPDDAFFLKVMMLIQVCEEMLQNGVTKAGMNTAMDMLGDIKEFWYRENVAVIVTTISKLDEKVIKAFDPAWTVCDESQYVSVHNITIWLATFHDKTRYMIGDIQQLSPYHDDDALNPYSDVRKDSLFAKDIKRGRPHALMSVSGRAGPSAITLASDLCYEGELTSSVKDHAYTQDIIAFHKKVFGSKSDVCPHLFINTGTGYDVQFGHRKSTANPELMNATKTYMDCYQKAFEQFKLSDISVTTPWLMQNSLWKKEFRQLGDVPPIAGTAQYLMGDEAIVLILEIAKTGSLGFLNMHGMWTVPLTRSKASTIVIANHDALMSAFKSKRTLKPSFAFYRELVAWFKQHGAFVDWPEELEMTRHLSDILEPTLQKFRELETDAAHAFAATYVTTDMEHSQENDNSAADNGWGATAEHSQENDNSAADNEWGATAEHSQENDNSAADNGWGATAEHSQENDNSAADNEWGATAEHSQENDNFAADNGWGAIAEYFLEDGNSVADNESDLLADQASERDNAVAANESSVLADQTQEKDKATADESSVLADQTQEKDKATADESSVLADQTQEKDKATAEESGLPADQTPENDKTASLSEDPIPENTNW